MLASERDGRHIRISYDFGGLLALFILATIKLNENYETERGTFVENLFGYEISDDDCESDRGNASGNESKQVVAGLSLASGRLRKMASPRQTQLQATEYPHCD